MKCLTVGTTLALSATVATLAGCGSPSDESRSAQKPSAAVAGDQRDILATVDKLALAGVPLMTAPNDIYYEMLEERLPGHGQPIPELKTRGILVDGSTEGGKPRLLLQIFSGTMLGPVFFEFIQRKGDDGFGEGNFKALFQSIERDQVRRGVLQTT